MIDVRVAAASLHREDLFPVLSSEERANLATIVLELGTNIVKYAGGGKILLRTLRSSLRQAIEVLAVDEGPGIVDIEQALQDHFTTGGTLGLGLGSVKRLASEFELSCPPHGGTRVRALHWCGAQSPQTGDRRTPAPAPVPPPSMTVATQEPVAETSRLLRLSTLERNRPALHQQASGDRLMVLDHGSLAFRIVLDGTGHGLEAHRIASEAAAAIEQDLNQQFSDGVLDGEGDVSPGSSAIESLIQSSLQAAHGRIRGSRGAAIGMAVIDRRQHRLHFAGIGNTRILLLADRGWEGISRDGQLGVSFRLPLIQVFPLAADAVVLQASDGIRTSSLRSQRPGRSGNVPDLETVASALLAQASFADDVSILLTRCHA